VIDASVIVRLIMREENYVEAARQIKTKTIMTFFLTLSPSNLFRNSTGS